MFLRLLLIHATETGISSGRVRLWLVRAFTLPTKVEEARGGKKIAGAWTSIVDHA